MLKQKLKNTRVRLIGALVVSALLASTAVVGGLVRADQFDDAIRQLQDQNNVNKSNSAQLGAQAASYQDQINKLQAQINSLTQSIADNQRKSDDLQKQIEAAQAELDRERDILGNSIKAMYLEGQISTLEILASSKDISEFVDKEQYRASVQNKIKSSVDKITELKLEMEKQQRELQGLIKDLQNQQSQLDSSRAEQSNLLAYTENQKASYDQQIKSNNAQIASLRAAQLAANRRLGGQAVAGDPNHGGYPAVWDRAAQDSMIDSWGMYNRECVSYTAWKVYQTYGYMPYWGGVGNANQWPGDAQAAGIPTGSIPKVGSVAISMGGAYGHAMWVEGVSGNTIYVSQYNYDLAGHYSEMSINGSGLIYLYFGE